MAIRFVCTCGLMLEAEDQYAGQPTICPQCGKQKKIPSKPKPAAAPPVAKLVPPPRPPAADPGFEVVENDEPIIAAPKARPRPALTMKMDEPDRPRRKKLASADDQPHKPRRLDEDDDNRPRKRKPNKRKVNPSGDGTARMWKILGGVGLLLLGVGLVIAWWQIDARRTGKLLIWGILAAVVGLGGIGTGMFGNVSPSSSPDDDDDDDFGE